LSSAEDKTSSTVLPSQGSSNSAHEEFPEDARQEPANEGSSSSANGAELKATDSPSQSPEEPGDDVEIPLKTKPLPKVNAAAREIRMKVTGTRVGSAFIERELFTESTATVLVFEKGGVIRLTAAVAPGQLIFLTNEESQREIVAQVMRKRAYRPTECYVEFEFTEPAPGFWGMEFSAATALLPQDKNVAAAAEMISSAETTDDELDAAPPHSAEEVEALKREVEALRSQLNLLQTPAEPSQLAPTAATPNPHSMPPVETHALESPKPEGPSYQSEKAPWTELSADVAPAAAEPKSPRVHTPDQDLLPKPALDFHVPVPKRSRSFRARGQFTPGFRSGMLRVVILSGVLAALIAFVWYKHWFPWMHQSTKFSVSTFAAGVTTKVATPGTSTSGSASLATQPTKAGTAAAADTLPAKEASPVTGASSGHSSVAKENEMAPYEVAEKPITREKAKPAASIATRPSPARSLPTKMVASAPSSTANPGFVPPKLIKSERAVATLEDLRDFETGSVVIDAFVDSDGSVESMTVLSGPPSLRRPALQALKDYKYEPATQNGHPIAAHVTVKIQFHFE
jgi:TonB family protein